MCAFPAISLEFEPGQLIAFSGSGGFGKSTLLRLLGKQLTPTDGFVTYPASWCVRYANTTPLIENHCLMFNLRYGNRHEHADKEIWALCEKVGVSADLLGRGDVQVRELPDAPVSKRDPRPNFAHGPRSASEARRSRTATACCCRSCARSSRASTCSSSRT